MARSTSVEAGMTIDRYVIERELGRGATALVYLARDRDAGRMVALKLMRDELVGTISTERFFKEIQRTGELQHPHIVPLLASGEHDGRPFCVLPFMDGGTLRQRLEKEKQLPLAEAVAICTQVARALAFAHGHNLIHRDVKPENILFTAGQATLADFGIARALERSSGGDSTTSTGIVRGTPAYMSPEQAVGDSSLDARTDIYSLGCVLYEMIAGVPAFVGPSPQAIISQRLNHPPRAMHVYRPSVPLALETVVAKMLATSAADRYRTCSEVADALQNIDLSGATSLSISVGTVTQRNRRVGAGLAAAGLVIAGAIALWLRYDRPAVTGIPQGDPHRVAVLYFEDGSPDIIPPYLVDGITEDLTGILAGVRPLSVSSPEAVRRFRTAGLALDSVSHALGVGTVVAGKATASKDSIRVAMRIVDAKTGQQLETASVNAPIGEAFALSGQLAERVGALLRQRLGDLLSTQAVEKQAPSREAWELTQQATALMRGGVIEGITRNAASSAGEHFAQADEILRRAEALEPSWGVPSLKRARLAISTPWMTLAPPGVDSSAYVRMPPPMRQRLWLSAASTHLDEALRRDPNLLEAVAVRGSMRLQLAPAGPGGDSLRALAEEDARRVVRERPSLPNGWLVLAEIAYQKGAYADAADDAKLAYDADAFFEIPTVTQIGFSTALRAGRYPDAREWCRLGQLHGARDPRFAECYLTLLGWTGKSARDVDSAWSLINGIEKADQQHLLDRTATYRRIMVAAVAARAGLRDSAQSILRSASSDEMLLPAAYVEVLLGDEDAALTLLEKQARRVGPGELAWHPWFASLRTRPRFQAIVTSHPSTSPAR